MLVFCCESPLHRCVQKHEFHWLNISYSPCFQKQFSLFSFLTSPEKKKTQTNTRNQTTPIIYNQQQNPQTTTQTTLPCFLTAGKLNFQVIPSNCCGWKVLRFKYLIWDSKCSSAAVPTCVLPPKKHGHPRFVMYTENDIYILYTRSMFFSCTRFFY